MKLGEADESGRRSPVETGKTISLKADTVITAVGEKIDPSLYQAIGAELDAKGRPVVDRNLQTSVKGVYAAGDCRRGPATVVKAIADAQLIAAAIVAEAKGITGEAAAEAMFEKYAPGGEVVCAPADFENTITAEKTPLLKMFLPDPNVFMLNSVAFHEWVGIVGYTIFR